MALCSVTSWGFEVNGAYFKVVSETDKTVEVTTGSYGTDPIVIPATVENGGSTYTVIGIGVGAFVNCKFTQISLPNTLTYIGERAFMNSSVTSLVVPDGVTTVGVSGLRVGGTLVSLVLPASLEAVSDQMCRGCTKLKGVVIPDKVTSIGEYAFASCSALDSIVLGESVTTLKASAFAYSQSFKYIKVKAAVPPTAANDACFSNNAFKATLYCKEKSLQAYMTSEPWSKFANILAYDPSGSAEDEKFVVAGVTYRQISKDDKTVAICFNDTLAYIGAIAVRQTVSYAATDFKVVGVDDGAFKNSKDMISLSLPASVTSIGANAFEGCTGLKYFTDYATTPQTLGANALAGINKTNCTLYVPDDVRAAYAAADQWKDFTKVGLILTDKIEVDGLYYSVANVEEGTLEFTSPTYPGKYVGDIVIPDQIDYKGLKFTCVGIGNNAFYNSDVTSLKVPSTLKYIANNAFYTFGKFDAPVKELVLPEGFTTIETNGFYGAHVLSVVLPKKSLTTIGNSAFYASDIVGISIPASIGKLASSAFSASDIQWVEIEDGITEIGSSAFYSCTKLGQVTIPNSVKLIGGSAFGACTGLSSISFGTGLDSVGSSAFYATSSLFKVFSFLPNPPASLTNEMNESGRNLAGRVTYAVSNNYTDQIAWGNVIVRPDLDKMFDVDGVRYLQAADGSAKVDAVDCAYDRNLPTVNVVDEITYNGKKYEVSTLGNALLMGNPFMTTMNYMSEQDMPIRLCAGARNLKVANLPDEMTLISQYAFSNCDSLSSIKLPSHLKTIDLAGFYYAGLKSLSVPGSVTLIDNASLAGMRKLEKFVLEDGEETLLMGFFPTMMGYNPMFMGAPLKEVVIGRKFNTALNTATYGYSPFYNDTVLEKVTITNYTTDITDHMFANCKRLQYVTMGDAVTYIYADAFLDCAALDSIRMGYRVKQIGPAFGGCSNVKRFICATNVPPKTQTNTFGDIDQNTCVLVVKEEAVADYKAAAQWKNFFHIEGADLGVNDIFADEAVNGYEVYDLSGVKVLSTRNADEVNALPNGLYIINGKKVMIRK